jgi:hypothetical protein
MLHGEPAPVCIVYGVALTMLHVLVECPHYSNERAIFHLHGMLCNMLGDDHCSVTKVMDFLNGIGLAKTI